MSGIIKRSFQLRSLSSRSQISKIYMENSLIIKIDHRYIYYFDCHLQQTSIHPTKETLVSRNFQNIRIPSFQELKIFLENT